MENQLNQPTGLVQLHEGEDYFQLDYALPSLPVFQGGPTQCQAKCPQELQLMTLINVPSAELHPQNIHISADTQDGLQTFPPGPLRAPNSRQPHSSSSRSPVQSNPRTVKKTGPEVLQKKALRLISHRKANQEYRQRNKEYLKRLEMHVAELEKKNKSLMEQIQDVKSEFEQNIQ
ncbi:uncharacterized protein ACB058_012029 [Synchiropus picturatus]